MAHDSHFPLNAFDPVTEYPNIMNNYYAGEFQEQNGTKRQPEIWAWELSPSTYCKKVIKREKRKKRGSRRVYMMQKMRNTRQSAFAKRKSPSVHHCNE
jgi:hypothetical protein